MRSTPRFASWRTKCGCPASGPGRRRGKLLEARLGTDIAREQALRDSLPEFYVDAVDRARRRRDRAARDRDHRRPGRRRRRVRSGRRNAPAGAPRRLRRVAGRAAVRARSTTTTIDDQVDRLRERFADLTDSDDPLIDDAYATIDISGSIDGETVEGLTATDFLYRVGSDMVVPELDDATARHAPGAILEFTATLPERFGDRAGQEATFRVLVKEAKHEGAARAHRRVGRRSQRVRHRRRAARRHPQAARDDAEAAGADGACATRCWKPSPISCRFPRPKCSSTTRRADASKISRTGCRIRMRRSNSTSQATGQEPQAFIDEVREGAVRAVLADLALRAVVAQEAIEAERRRGRRRDRAPGRTGSKRRSKRYGAISNGEACWRRYALILHVGRRSNSSSSTPPWSTRKAT